MESVETLEVGGKNGSVDIGYSSLGNVGLIFDPKAFDLGNRIIMTSDDARAMAKALVDAAMAAEEWKRSERKTEKKSEIKP
jgi:hypothetical protein